MEPTATIRPYVLRTFSTVVAPRDRRRGDRPGVHTSWESVRLWDQGGWEKWVKFEPKLDIPQEFWGNNANFIKLVLNRPDLDLENTVKRCKEVSVPNFDIVGWFDCHNNNMALFRAMVSEAKTEVAREGSKIIIGPWIHGSSPRRLGPIDFGPEAILDSGPLVIRWFDYWLKGIQNGVDKEPPVRIFVMGDNKWRDEQQWPLHRAKDKVLFVTSNGHANTATGDGKLIYQRWEQAGNDQYFYDPKDPVPSIVELSELRKHYMPVDQRPLADRKDILVYLTEPLKERVEVTGYPVVELYASSSAPDTDWFVRLIDVHPDGLAIDVSLGVLRARYRNGFDKSEFLKPDEVVKFTIRMRPTSNAFLPGHRIRLDITSSDFPSYDRNHNTATNQNADATLVVANQTIFHGGDYATRIILPWVPNPPKEEKPEEEEKVEQGSVKHVHALHQAAANGDIDQVRILIAKGVDVNAHDDAKLTPLHYVAKSGIAEIVQLLLEAGADVDAKEGKNNEKTPLYYAAAAGNKEVVKLLVEAGADINDVGKNNWPPLCVAIEGNQIAVVEYLIAHGADINASGALGAAAYYSNVEMVQLLIANGADINATSWIAIHAAVVQRRRDTVEFLIKNGADINLKDSDGRTALYKAFQRGYLDIARLLEVNGAEVGEEVGDLSLKDDRGLTDLHNAAVVGNQKLAELLLSKGAKVDERDDNYEFTALHYAARFGTTKVAEVLIAHGADIKAKDKWAYEPIHWAAYHDRPEIIELLIAKGADVNVKTSLGKTPLELAKPRRNMGAIEVLRKHGAKE